MINKVLLTFLLCGLCDGVTREYHFVNLTMSWTEAQQYCRQHYTDLATVTNMEEVNKLNRPSSSSGLAWIGLFDDPASWRNIGGTDSNSWRWSVTGNTSTSLYQKWAGFEPNHWNLQEKCVLVRYDGVWFDDPCSYRYVFVCYTGSKNKVFDIVTTPSTWDQAQAYCRRLYTDLAVIESAAENSQVTSLVKSSGYSWAWFGLYREPWKWSDNTTSSFTNWGNVGNYITDSNCAAENTTHSWYPEICDKRLPFFCYRKQGVTREYQFINLTMSWTEAQQYCRQHYTDLATVTNMEEVNRLNRTSSSSGLAWIGLFDDPASWRNIGGNDSNSWRWSVTGNTSTSLYQKWQRPEPNHESLEEKCVRIDSNGYWFDKPCFDLRPFFCYNGSNEKLFYLVTTLSTWDQARAYCRQHYTDLAVIESAAENSQVSSHIQSTEYYHWIGLYRELWRWSDSIASSFTNWGNVGFGITDYNCAAENTTHLWYPQTCDQRLPFFCYREAKKKPPVVRIQFIKHV